MIVNRQRTRTLGAAAGLALALVAGPAAIITSAVAHDVVPVPAGSDTSAVFVAGSLDQSGVPGNPFDTNGDLDAAA